MGKNNYFANKGVERNKKPLKNIMYRVEFSRIKPENVTPEYAKYKFKEEGYLILNWRYQDKISGWYWHGLITPADLKELLGVEQWRKFCNGKREFIVQRRIDGKNIPLEKNTKKDLEF